VNTVTLVAYFTEIRAVAIRAVLGVAPPVGTPETGLASHVDAGAPPADAVDAHFSLPETAHVGAVGRIAEPARAPLSLRTGYPHAAPLHALLVDAYLPVSGTVLGWAVDGVTLPGCTALSVRAGYIHATGRLAFLIDANLPDTRAIPPHTVFRVTIPAGTGGPRRAIPIQAGDFHAFLVHANESFGAVPHQAVERKALAADDDPICAFFLVDGSGRASYQQEGQQRRKRQKGHRANLFFHWTHLHLEAFPVTIRRLPCAPLGPAYPHSF
jgi:hypothetical protein